jgi:hypothetical protein
MNSRLASEPKGHFCQEHAMKTARGTENASEFPNNNILAGQRGPSNVTAHKRRCENNITTNPQGNGYEEVECIHLLKHVRATANKTVKFQVPNLQTRLYTPTLRVLGQLSHYSERPRAGLLNPLSATGRYIGFCPSGEKCREPIYRFKRRP